MTASLEFLLGLPYLRGPLLAKARDIRAPVLVSANSFSRWSDRNGYREWSGFKAPPAELIASMPVHLDSAGFVAAAKYRGWPWSVDAYLDLCAAAPWRWFASMDWCVEPEVAGDEAAVLDRISGTVALNIQCMRAAAERGIQGRLMPVIQGWEPDHYLRCLDRLSGFLAGAPLLGVGSMCRRHVEGLHGVLQVVDTLDRALPPGVGLHLFGLKSQAMTELRGHPRIASVDSQAYGVRARQLALDGGHSKTEAFVAGVMADWHARQMEHLAEPGFRFRPPNLMLPLGRPAAGNAFEARWEAARESLRQLHEDGELAWSGVNDRWTYEAMGLDDEDETGSTD